MSAQQKYEIALKFQNEGNEVVYQAIMETLTDEELLELLVEA